MLCYYIRGFRLTHSHILGLWTSSTWFQGLGFGIKRARVLVASTGDVRWGFRSLEIQQRIVEAQDLLRSSLSPKLCVATSKHKRINGAPKIRSKKSYSLSLSLLKASLSLSCLFFTWGKFPVARSHPSLRVSGLAPELLLRPKPSTQKCTCIYIYIYVCVCVCIMYRSRSILEA